jgi:hypothetical protein
MYPASFEYHTPTTLAEAIALLGRYGDEAKVISGSQSLIPLMKLRLAQPGHLVDLRKVDGLTGVREVQGALQIGALTTHADLAKSELLRAKLPMAAEAAGQIGDAQVRNLGTIGGSLAHADPSADWPAVLTALDASVVVAGPQGERTLEVEQLIVGPHGGGIREAAPPCLAVRGGRRGGGDLARRAEHGAVVADRDHRTRVEGDASHGGGAGAAGQGGGPGGDQVRRGARGGRAGVARGPVGLGRVQGAARGGVHRARCIACGIASAGALIRLGLFRVSS